VFDAGNVLAELRRKPSLALLCSAWPFPRVNAVLRILGGAFSVLAGIALVLE
jgi:hypothetical protein